MLVLSLLAWPIHACTASDPTLGTSEPTDAGTPATPDSAAPDGGVPIYGVFLSSTVYPTDFAKDAGSDLVAFVDGLCAHAAEVAGLDHSGQYHALVTLSSDAQAEISRVTDLRATAAGGGQWCSIASTHPPRPACAGSGLLFDATDDLRSGLRSDLLTDEYGNPAPPVDAHFYSGFAYKEGASTFFDGYVRNCTGWSVAIELANGEEPGPEKGFGLGQAVQATRNSTLPYKWMAERYAYCETRYAYPLFCIERPQ